MRVWLGILRQIQFLIPKDGKSREDLENGSKARPAGCRGRACKL